MALMPMVIKFGTVIRGHYEQFSCCFRLRGNIVENSVQGSMVDIGDTNVILGTYESHA